MSDLFAAQLHGTRTELAAEAVVLHGFALVDSDMLLAGVEAVVQRAPFRHLTTPGGHVMQVASTRCGPLGWMSDRGSYRYTPVDPLTDRPWPGFPAGFVDFAVRAADAAGFSGFAPDSCLINRYAPGTRLSLHQDRDEHDQRAPVVSVSLGLPATFLFGGFRRGDRTVRVPLQHGDVVAWGGGDRMRFHGVLPVSGGRHPATGHCRINITFRKVR